MDQSEQHVLQHLRHRGFQDVLYEPDGNVPPDFLVNNRIAVEVRRLNQNYITALGYSGLEEIAIPLSMKLNRLLVSLGPSEPGMSWFVRHRFRRPLLPWAELESLLRKHLSQFQRNYPNLGWVKVSISDDFELDLIRASDTHPSFFVYGGYSDDDSGGWVLHETLKNLKICVEEKSRKTAPFREKYGEWWLVLIDFIGYGVQDCDRKTFNEHLAMDHQWDKVILLNPLDPRSAFEL